MAKTVNIKLSSSTGSSTGPTFDLYSNVDNYVTAFETGVLKTTLMSTNGYTSTVVPDSATTIRVKSIGTCTSYGEYNLSSIPPTPTPTPTLTPTPTPTPTPTSVCYEYEITTTTSASVSYIDCDGQSGIVSIGGASGYDLARFCSSDHNDSFVLGGDVTSLTNVGKCYPTPTHTLA